MTLSSLIKELTYLKETHDDIDVGIQLYEYGLEDFIEHQYWLDFEYNEKLQVLMLDIGMFHFTRKT